MMSDTFRWSIAVILLSIACAMLALNWTWRRKGRSTVVFVAPFFSFWGGLAAPVTGLAWIAVLVAVSDPATWSVINGLIKRRDESH